jgi:hypothetical protein
MTKFTTALVILASAVMLVSCGDTEKSTDKTVDSAEVPAYADNEKTPANQSDIIGAWVNDDRGIIMLFDEDNTYVMTGGNVGMYDNAAENGYLSDSTAVFLYDDMLTVVNEDPDGDKVTFERYDPQKLTAEMLEGFSTTVSDANDNGSDETETRSIYFSDNCIMYENGASTIGSFNINYAENTITLSLQGGVQTYRYYALENYLYLIGSNDFYSFSRPQNNLINLD